MTDTDRLAASDPEEAMRLALLYVFQAKTMTPFTATAVIRALAQDGWTLTRGPAPLDVKALRTAVTLHRGSQVFNHVCMGDCAAAIAREYERTES